jgi:hypothetical protein
MEYSVSTLLTFTVKKRESGRVAKTTKAEKSAMRSAQQPAPSASPAIRHHDT